MSPPFAPFVFGHPRSGTSLLTAILDRHSLVAMLPETHLLSSLSSGPAPKGHEHLLLLAWDQVRSRLGDLRFSPEQILQRFLSHPCTPEGLLHALLELWAERVGKPVAGEKTPAHLHFADRILSGIPGSRAILLVRDGRSVIAAMRRTPSHAEAPIERLVESWVKGARMMDRWLAEFPERSRLVRFEDLVTVPEATLVALLHWLGLEFEPTMLHPAPTETYRRWEDYVKRDVLRAIMPEKAQTWEAAEALLPSESLAEIAPWLGRFGYPPSSRPIPFVSKAPSPSHPPRHLVVPTSPPVLLIGAHRAGTATIQSWLGTHPDVASHPNRPRPYLALDWPLTTEQLLRHLGSELHDSDRGRRIWLHAASYYFAHPDLPRRVARALPDSRIILMLRDPVDRAFSHWLRSWRSGVEDLDFERALGAEEARLGDAERLLGSDETAVSIPHVHYSYLLQSRYGSHLTRWLATLPSEQILVLFLDDLLSDPTSTWIRLCGHAELPVCLPPVIKQIEALAWPLTPTAVRRTPSVLRLMPLLQEEMERLSAAIDRPVPWHLSSHR